MALRVPLLLLYALLVPTAALLAMRIPSEGAILGLVMRDDPDWLATHDFQKVFPEGQFVLLLLESEEPFQPAALDRARSPQDNSGREEGFIPAALSFKLFQISDSQLPGLGRSNHLQPATNNPYSLPSASPPTATRPPSTSRRSGSCPVVGPQFRRPSWRGSEIGSVSRFSRHGA